MPPPPAVSGDQQAMDVDASPHHSGRPEPLDEMRTPDTHHPLQSPAVQSSAEPPAHLFTSPGTPWEPPIPAHLFSRTVEAEVRDFFIIHLKVCHFYRLLIVNEQNFPWKTYLCYIFFIIAFLK